MGRDEVGALMVSRQIAVVLCRTGHVAWRGSMGIAIKTSTSRPTTALTDHGDPN